MTGLAAGVAPGLLRGDDAMVVLGLSAVGLADGGLAEVRFISEVLASAADAEVTFAPISGDPETGGLTPDPFFAPGDAAAAGTFGFEAPGLTANSTNVWGALGTPGLAVEVTATLSAAELALSPKGLFLGGLPLLRFGTCKFSACPLDAETLDSAGVIAIFFTWAGDLSKSSELPVAGTDSLLLLLPSEVSGGTASETSLPPPAFWACCRLPLTLAGLFLCVPGLAIEVPDFSDSVLRPPLLPPMLWPFESCPFGDCSPGVFFFGGRPLLLGSGLCVTSAPTEMISPKTGGLCFSPLLPPDLAVEALLKMCEMPETLPNRTFGFMSTLSLFASSDPATSSLNPPDCRAFQVGFLWNSKNKHCWIFLVFVFALWTVKTELGIRLSSAWAVH